MAHREVTFQPGTLFHGRYRVVRCLKEGGMGAVYEVMDEKTAASRALKVMLPSLLENEGLRARFAREARVTGGIESDHIVRTSDAGVDDATGTPFIVMDLLRGEDLGALLKRRKQLPPREVALYLFQAARALDKTHAASIIHRDLKPDNLFLTFRDDGSPCVKILDFGIAKAAAMSDPSIKTRPMMGTPLYMSPEQVRNEADIGPAADIYALGHIAYTLLVGESYWAEEAETISSPFLLITEIMRGSQEPATARALRRREIALPAAFDPWFTEATALAAENRFDHASEAIEALGAALSVKLPRVMQPSFDLLATNPEVYSDGDELSLHGARTTADLHLPASMEGGAPPGFDTPTALTGHSQIRVDPAVGITNPHETGISRSRRESGVPLTTGIVESAGNEPTSAMAARPLAREATPTLVASGSVGRAAQVVHDKSSPVAVVSARTVARGAPPAELPPKSTSFDRPPSSSHRGRDYAAPPTGLSERSTPRASAEERASSKPAARERPPPASSARDNPGSHLAPRERATSSKTPARELTPPPSTSLRSRPASMTAGREPTPPLPPHRDPTTSASLTGRLSTTGGRGTAPPTRPNPSSRETGATKSDAPPAYRFQISADTHRSILRLKVWGFWTLDESKAYWEEFRQKAQMLVGRRWYVLADISDFPPQRDDVREFLEKPMTFARENGMVRAANLVSSALSKMAIARMSAEMGLPAFLFFSSEAEALTWLLHD